MADDAPNDRVFITFLVVAFIFLVSLMFVLFPRHGAFAPEHASLSGATSQARANV
jgi:hypothetical protein